MRASHDNLCRRVRTTGHCRAFTLTEMLVALGIILLLLGILMPTLYLAQRQAKRTQCLARLREIGRSVQLYITDYNDYLPPGGSMNGGVSPGSPHNLTPFVDVSIGAGRGVPGSDKLWPEEMGGFARYLGPPGFPYSVPPLAYFVQKYIKPQRRMWECPAAPRNAFVMTPLAPADKDEAVVGALAGWRPEDAFLPSYRYMGTAEFWFGIHSPKFPEHNFENPLGNPARGGRWHAFLDRNIGGLRLISLRTETGLPKSAVVVAYEADGTNHNRETSGYFFGDVSFDGTRFSGTGNQPARGEWAMNVAYLDGHVEYKTFNTERQFWELLHDPVPQRWGYLTLRERTRITYPWKVIGSKPIR